MQVLPFHHMDCVWKKYIIKKGGSIMQTYSIEDKKLLMAKLLKSDLFDTFEVREVILHMRFKIFLEGVRNQDFYDSEADTFLSKYVSWGEMRKNIYELMQGHHLPSYFKIVLSTTSEKTISISEEVSCFFLNFTFKDNMLICTTGTAYKNFTLDKTPEMIWDKKIEQFFFQYHFI